jgi:putative DNA primase/helicase
LRAELYAYLDRCMAVDKEGELRDVRPNTSMVGNVLDGLRAAAHLDDATATPTWLDHVSDLVADEIVACENGLLHLPTLNFLPHTPAFFTQNALDLSFDPNAPEPRQWLDFLCKLWPNDEVTISTLQEMFGLALTGDTRHQKAFLLVGP